MISNNPIDYTVIPFKKMTSPNNKELVTMRANVVNKRIVITFSIGTDICELLDFNKSDRINIFHHKRERNVYLLKKSQSVNEGYLLAHAGSNNTFMTFKIRYPGMDGFRLSQTIPIDYELNDDGTLLLNIEKILWRK